jgi:quinol monooxygenase YgiN
MKKGSAMQEMKKEPAKSGTVTVIVTHEVKEYTSWRKVYDADEPNRKMMGFKVWGVYRDAKSPNWVSIIGTFPNAGAVDAFMASPKLKEAMENAGVLGKPDVKVLTAAAK